MGRKGRDTQIRSCMESDQTMRLETRNSTQAFGTILKHGQPMRLSNETLHRKRGKYPAGWRTAILRIDEIYGGLADRHDAKILNGDEGTKDRQLLFHPLSCGCSVSMLPPCTSPLEQALLMEATRVPLEADDHHEPHDQFDTIRRIARATVEQGLAQGYLEEHSSGQSAMGGERCLSEHDFHRELDKAIRKLDADGTGLRDFANAAVGGRIVSGLLLSALLVPHPIPR